MSKCAPMSPGLRRLLDRKYGHLFPDVDYTQPMVQPTNNGDTWDSFGWVRSVKARAQTKKPEYR
jgi:hypothetical protein